MQDHGLTFFLLDSAYPCVKSRLYFFFFFFFFDPNSWSNAKNSWIAASFKSTAIPSFNIVVWEIPEFSTFRQEVSKLCSLQRPVGIDSIERVFTLGNCKKFIARKQEVLVRIRIDKKEVKEQSKTRKRYPTLPCTSELLLVLKNSLGGWTRDKFYLISQFFCFVSEFHLGMIREMETLVSTTLAYVTANRQGNADWAGWLGWQPHMAENKRILVTS